MHAHACTHTFKNKSQETVSKFTTTVAARMSDGVPPSCLMVTVEGYVDSRLSPGLCCMEKEHSSQSKTRIMPDRASEGLWPGPWRSCTSDPKNPILPTLRQDL